MLPEEIRPYTHDTHFTNESHFRLKTSPCTYGVLHVHQFLPHYPLARSVNWGNQTQTCVRVYVRVREHEHVPICVCVCVDTSFQLVRHYIMYACIYFRIFRSCSSPSAGILYFPSNFVHENIIIRNACCATTIRTRAVNRIPMGNRDNGNHRGSGR